MSKETSRIWAQKNSQKCREASARWRANHPGQAAENCKRYRERHPSHARDQMYRLKYGIGLAEYQALHDDQNGLCAICFNHHDRLHVDHDHNTGAIRGLLCGSCNKALGLLGDDVDRIASAMDYLECHAIDRRMAELSKGA